MCTLFIAVKVKSKMTTAAEQQQSTEQIQDMQVVQVINIHDKNSVIQHDFFSNLQFAISNRSET